MLGDRLWLLQRGGGDGRGGRDRRRADARKVMDSLQRRPAHRPARARRAARLRPRHARRRRAHVQRRDAGGAGAARLHRVGRGARTARIRGSVVGTLDRDGHVQRLRTIDRRYKVEGVHATIDTGVMDFLFVCDQDDPETPSPLLAAAMPVDGALERGGLSGATPARARRSRAVEELAERTLTPPATAARAAPSTDRHVPAGSSTDPATAPGRTATATRTSPPRTNAHALRPRLQRLVVARERLRPPRAQRAAAGGRARASRPPAARRRPRARASSSRAALLPVDRAPVVRVHERERGQLVALVDVGHAGHGELQRGLAQRGLDARRGRSPPATGSKSSRNGRCS